MVGSHRGYIQEEQGKARPRRRDGEGSVSLRAVAARVVGRLGRRAQRSIERPAMDTNGRRESRSRARAKRAGLEGRSAVARGSRSAPLAIARAVRSRLRSPGHSRAALGPLCDRSVEAPASALDRRSAPLPLQLLPSLPLRPLAIATRGPALRSNCAELHTCSMRCDFAGRHVRPTVGRT